MYKKPIQILSLRNDRSLQLNTYGLKSILLKNSIKNLPLVVVSIVGDFRKGKSFMLNFFLQYLQSTNNENWMHDVSQTEGFYWRDGIERETTGWLMWPEPLIKNLSNGTKVAIILIDSQGAKDHESPLQDCVQLFSLSVLCSSILVINQKNNIQESDFEDLGLLLDYGLAVLKDHPNEEPFQKLTFLIRDWNPTGEVRFGYEAGKVLFNRKMEIGGRQTPEMIRIRKNIRSCFSSIECFLMHIPGLDMIENDNFKGSLHNMRKVFIKDVKEFVTSLLSTENLVVKRINGKEITGNDLYEYIVMYFDQFSNGDMPKVESLTALNSKISILFAKNEALNCYTAIMDRLLLKHEYKTKRLKLKDKHIIHSSRALNIFDNMRKLGSTEHFETYRNELNLELEKHFILYTERNDIKREKSCFDSVCFK